MVTKEILDFHWSEFNLTNYGYFPTLQMFFGGGGGE